MARSDRSASAALNANVCPPNAALDALAAELAPRVAEILLARSSANDGDDALAELLARAGYEIESEPSR